MSKLSNEAADALAALAKELGGVSWENLRDDQKQQVFVQIATALVGKDNETAAKALVSALDDGRITNAEWRQILLAWAGAHTTDATAKDVLTAFGDGTLSQQEAANIALKWATRQTSGDLKAFLQHVSTFSVTGAAKAALITYIEKSGLKPNVADKLKTAIDTGRISANEMLELVIAWAAASAPADLAALLKQIPRADPEKIALAWLNSRLPAEERAVLTAFLEKDWASLLGSILGALKIDLGDQLLQELAQGRFRDAAIDALADILKRSHVEHPGELAKALVELATGARQLFASIPESDAGAFLNTPELVALWREVRVAIYAAQLITKDFDVVPSVPGAQPHVFEMAAIRFTTPVAQLLAPGAKQRDREEFVTTLNATVDVQFAGRIQPFTGVSDVIPPTFFEPSRGVICRTIFSSVFTRPKP